MSRRIVSPLFAAIGDHRVDSDNARSVTVRLPLTMHAYVSLMADENGRSPSDEIRAALGIHIDLHRLTLYADDELYEERYRESGGEIGMTAETAASAAAALRSIIADEWAKSFPYVFRKYADRFPAFFWRDSSGQP